LIILVKFKLKIGSIKIFLKKIRNKHPLSWWIICTLVKIISWAIKWISKAIVTVGVLTFLQYILYFSHPFDYESINVINVDNLSTKEVYEQYDIVDQIDFDINGEYDYHKEFVFGPQETLMEDIKFSELNKQMDGYNKTNFQPFIKDLEPQQYLFVRVPTSDLTGIVKVNFNINFKEGEYLLSPNMRNGHEDKVVLKVNKTWASFIND